MEGEEVFVSRKNKSDCFSAFQDMRKRGVLCDVEIHADKNRIQAHRVFLAATIPYFKAMFTNNLMESKEKEVILHGVDPLALENVIDYVYGTAIKISTVNVFSLLDTSTYLHVESLTESCFEFLNQNITMQTAVTLREYARSANKARVFERADVHIRANFERFLKSEELKRISHSTLRELISRDELFVTREEVVFEGLISWVVADKDHRREYLPDLLRHVRLPLLDLRYLNEKVSTDELIRQSKSCRDLVDAAKQSNALSIFPMREREWPEKVYSVCEDDSLNGYVSCYNPTQSRWIKLVDLLTYDSCVHNVVCGEGIVHIFFCDTLKTLDLKTFQVNEKRMSVGSSEARLVFHHGQLYLFGGSNTDSEKKIFTFDPKTATYLETGEMFEKRFSPKALPVGEYIYVFGGYNKTSYLRTVEKHNPLTNESILVSPMLSTTRDYDVATVNGKIYLYGRCIDDVSSDICTLYVYSPLRDDWNVVRRMMCIGRRRLSMVTYTNKLLIMNRTSTGDISSMDIYDPSEDQWKFEDFMISSSESKVLCIVTHSTS